MRIAGRNEHEEDQHESWNFVGVLDMNTVMRRGRFHNWGHFPDSFQHRVD